MGCCPRPARGASVSWSLLGVVVVRRIVTAIALASCLSGCDRPGVQVPLLTGVSPDACYAGGESGMTGPLVADATYGTSFNGRPVMWPVGFRARLAGDEVEVLDSGGRVRATTGRVYHISIAPVYDNSKLLERSNAYPAAVLCDYAWDFVDCTADPANRYCRAE
jgi:hypothetical protein